MNTRLTPAEMAELKPLEVHFRAAMCDYLRALGRADDALLHRVYERVTGKQYQRSDACGVCQLTLTKTVAKWYYDTQKAMAAEAAAAAAPAPAKKPRTNTKKK